MKRAPKHEEISRCAWPKSDLALRYHDREWGVLRGTALTLAESGNLLMMPGRARDQGDWIKDSKLLVDAGAAAYKAAQKHDLQAILDLNEQLTTSCTKCHVQYRPNYGKR